ncbi:SDR family NAD(P)-dependent oxidoreductase [Micromonospora sp. NPDC005257]|uniref:SDR family NAD(P)-dependent oxidoreductase n=1 Tax=Micromonospora sp. NPDC005257 TaxID=3364230 RepID=UPI0036992C2D
MSEAHGTPEEGAATPPVADEGDRSGLPPRRAHDQDAGPGAGRAVLVTGAASGMGWAIAKRFAAAGDRVALLDKAAGVADELLGELDGTGHVAVQADLMDSAAVRIAVDSAAERLGGLDVLVNNAGVFTLHPITEVSYEVWQQHWQSTLGPNLIGAANVTWCAVQHLKEHGGRIVNVSSRGAFRGEPEAPAYGASKAGLNSFGQSLALALAPYRISVATVAPGFVRTPMAKEYLEAPGGDAIRAQSPFGRVGEPDEIAAAVFYLASEKAEWASGAVLDLNGASYLRT